MKEEKINIPRMKEDLVELNNQIDIYLKLQSDNRVGKAYMKLMEKIIDLFILQKVTLVILIINLIRFQKVLRNYLIKIFP